MESLELIHHPCSLYRPQNNFLHKIGDGGIPQPTLKQVQLPIVDHLACQTKLRESPKIPKTFKLDSSLLCAGGEENKDTCEGDGGGPLVCPAKTSGEEEKFIQVSLRRPL